jgi:hypothetical protein
MWKVVELLAREWPLSTLGSASFNYRLASGETVLPVFGSAALIIVISTTYEACVQVVHSLANKMWG